MLFTRIKKQNTVSWCKLGSDLQHIQQCYKKKLQNKANTNHFYTTVIILHKWVEAIQSEPLGGLIQHLKFLPQG